MARVKTFVNGGSLLPGDLNSIQDDYEFGFSTYKELPGRSAYVPSGQVAATLILANADGTQSVAAAAAGSVPAITAFYLDPADLTANTRSNKYRVRAACHVNAVAPAANFTVGLYPVATWGGASGADPIIATLGAVVAGSTIAFNAPAASSAGQGNSGDFTAPAAGWYALAVVVSATTAANSRVSLRAVVQNRQV